MRSLRSVTLPPEASRAASRARRGIWRGASLLNVGMEELLAGRLDAARPLIVEARERFEEAENFYGARAAMLVLADLLTREGQLRQADQLYLQVYAQAGDDLLFNYNFEMIGYSNPSANAQTVPLGLDLLFPGQYAELESWGFTGDWIALIVDYEGVEHATYMSEHASELGLPHLLLDIPEGAENQPLLADLRRSDHAAFWAVNYPAMMITDTSEFRYDNYHCNAGEDAVELLDHDFARNVIASAVGGAADSLGL